MKVFLCADKSKKTKDDKLILNGDEFKTAALERSEYAFYIEERKKNLELKKKADFPNVLRAGQILFGLLGAIALVTIFSCIKDNTDPSVTEGASFLELSIFALVGIGIAVLAQIYGEKRKKKILSSDEIKESEKSLSEIAKGMFTSLGVPEDAENVDVLAFIYKEAEGNIGIVPDKNGYKNADNCRLRLFKEGESLVLCSLDKKFSFEISALKGLKKEKCDMHLSYWHKEKSFKDEEFKEYNLSLDNSKIRIRECVILYLEKDIETENGKEKENWCIYFPNYEIKTLEKITGMKAE